MRKRWKEEREILNGMILPIYIRELEGDREKEKRRESGKTLNEVSFQRYIKDNFYNYDWNY